MRVCLQKCSGSPRLLRVWGKARPHGRAVRHDSCARMAPGAMLEQSRRCTQGDKVAVRSAKGGDVRYACSVKGEGLSLMRVCRCELNSAESGLHNSDES